jgi:Eukaryotic porin
MTSCLTPPSSFYKKSSQDQGVSSSGAFACLLATTHDSVLLVFHLLAPPEIFARSQFLPVTKNLTINMSSLALEKDSPLGFLVNNSVVAALADTYTSFSERRAALGLSNPGTVENIAREVQRDVFLNNYTFQGLRADLTKAFSIAPLFQVSHAFAMGSQGLPPYTFAALYGTNTVSCSYAKLLSPLLARLSSHPSSNLLH